MKKIPVWIIVVIVVAVLIASKFLFFPKAEQKVGGKAGSGAAAGDMPVTYHIARTSSFSNDLFAAGRVGALNAVDIVPEIAGRVTKISFNEGEQVKKGALLIKLNDADLQAQLAKIRTQAKLASQKMQRLQKLLEVEGVSREEFEMQENELAALKADESFVLAQIEKTNITAPFDGVVGLENISVGSFVSTSSPIVSLVQLQPVFIEFSVPEKYQQEFRNGLKVSFTSDNTQSTGTHTASIYAIEPRVDEATKTIKARALYKGPRTFYPGGFVKVNVNMGDINSAIMLPTQCVIPTIDGQKVFAVKNGTATEVQVQIGLRTDKHIQVTEGVRSGDTIVASGLLGVKQGAKLKLVDEVN